MGPCVFRQPAHEIIYIFDIVNFAVVRESMAIVEEMFEELGVRYIKSPTNFTVANQEHRTVPGLATIVEILYIIAASVLDRISNLK